MIVLALNPYHKRCLFQVYVCMYIHILALAIFFDTSNTNIAYMEVIRRPATQLTVLTKSV